MAYEPRDNGGGQRKMFKGNWTCSKCGAPITELPFEPDPARVGELMCFDCMKAKKGYGNNPHRERKMYKGNWKCSKCGAPITELPFEPDPAKVGGLLCLDCYRAKNGR